MSPVSTYSNVLGVMCACVVLVATTRGPFTITKDQEAVTEVHYNPPSANLKQGMVLGTVEKSLKNRNFFSFKGIPYALPPVGNLRFKPPQPIISYQGVINATSEAPKCVQKNYLLQKPVVSGQEDCLYLNVYTPQIEGKTKLPVMVYIHGGGWFTGSGTSYELGPKHLLDKDVVLVTFNYRLGALGFLSTGTRNTSGNYGMKDQVEVLRWVKNNIHEFGGDNELVTIFGQSAGAASAHYHMLSPLSKDLFHRVISQSGTVMSPWSWPGDALAIARRQGVFVNCTQESTAELVGCLRMVDAHRLVESGDNFHRWSIDPMTTFRPVLEPDVPGAFLTQDPLKTIKYGKFKMVPWMLGVVAQEGIIRGVPIVSNDELLHDLNAYWTSLGPFLFELSKSVSKDKVDELWLNMTSFYIQDNLPVGPDNALGLIDMYSDRGFVHGTHKSVLLHAARGHKNIFLYHFNYRTSQPVSYQFAFAPNSPRSYGVSHCDDLLYLFNSPGIFQGWPSEPNDLKVVNALVKLWTDFAKYGNPTSTNSNSTSHRLSCALTAEECDLDSLEWNPMPINGSATQTTYLYIRNSTADANATLEFSMEEGLFKDRMDFWDRAPLLENFDGNPRTDNKL